MICPSCARENPDDSRFCSGCGTGLDPESAPTMIRPDSSSQPAAAAPDDAPTPRTTPRKPKSVTGTGGLSTSSAPSVAGSRFAPGAVLAERYRIVALVGRGGAGEVYRAEDLKLGQTVALKFLPESLAEDGAALARFHREVRIARQVSHASVCRVFDIGEVEGLQFLTMEYVDGEDLASLMRRVGRLGPEKSREIARQICAGLAAAHEHGILHRDLKPANIMLDSRGKARITDFGLAELAHEVSQEDVRAGTPAYTSPEQFTGQGVTIKSDIYSLGLVLYELFTGKRAFQASTMKELTQQREQGTISHPSAVARDLDPRVERVILQCLERVPAKRPATALQVAAALPGGDPLAAALAAGETPSPEMVAAAGATEGLRPAIGWACLAATVLLAGFAILMNQSIKLFRHVPFDRPPDALADRARQIQKKLGYTARPADTARGYTTDDAFFQYISAQDHSPSRWSKLDRGEVAFWYRESPRPLAAGQFLKSFMAMGTVAENDPPLAVTGMTLLRLNPRGVLLAFEAVPPQREDPAAAKNAPDWNVLFAEAQLDPARWTPAEPQWTPNSYCDLRAAWTGTRADRPDEPLRIEAAAYRARPVFFSIIGPWTKPERMNPYQETGGQAATNFFLVFTFLIMIVGGAYFSRKNLRQGRGDRRGAFRLAAAIFLAIAASWIFGADHVANFSEAGNFLMFAGWALFLSGVVWIIYIALEPYVRRLWPTTIISWSRLLTGGWRDPLVGRDILFGCLAGAAIALAADAASVLPAWLGSPSPEPDPFPTPYLLGIRRILSLALWLSAVQVFQAIAVLFLLLFLRWIFRRQWAAAAALVVIMSIPRVMQSGAPPVFRVFLILVWLILVFVLLRYGLVALVAARLFSLLLGGFPITTDTSAWYAGIGYFAMILMGSMAFYGFYTALAGKPMFGGAAALES